MGIEIDEFDHYFHQVVDTIKRPKDNITWLVMKDLQQRAERGVNKYNTTLEENNTDNFLQHLYEELLDAAQYVKKEIETRKHIQQLILESPNDNILAAKVRQIYGQKKA